MITAAAQNHTARRSGPAGWRQIAVNPSTPVTRPTYSELSLTLLGPQYVNSQPLNPPQKAPISSPRCIDQLVAYSHPVDVEPAAVRGLNGRYSTNGQSCAPANSKPPA